MNAFDRMTRIQKCLSIWEGADRGDLRGLALELNPCRLRSDEQLRQHTDRDGKTGKFVGRWWGHVVDGETAEAAAEALEAKVFETILKAVGEDIQKHDKRATELRALKELLDSAMRGR